MKALSTTGAALVVFSLMWSMAYASIPVPYMVPKLTNKLIHALNVLRAYNAYTPTVNINADFSANTVSCDSGASDPSDLPTCYGADVYSNSLTAEAQVDVENGVLSAEEAMAWTTLSYSLVEVFEGTYCPSSGTLAEIQKLKMNLRKSSRAQPTCNEGDTLGGATGADRPETNVIFTNNASFDVDLMAYTALNETGAIYSLAAGDSVGMTAHAGDEFIMKKATTDLCVEVFRVTKEDQQFDIDDHYDGEVTVINE